MKWPVPLTLGRLARPIVKVRKEALLAAAAEHSDSSDSDFSSKERLRDLEMNDAGSSVVSEAEGGGALLCTQTFAWGAIVSMVVLLSEGLAFHRAISGATWQ